MLIQYHHIYFFVDITWKQLDSCPVGWLFCSTCINVQSACGFEFLGHDITALGVKLRIVIFATVCCDIGI